MDGPVIEVPESVFIRRRFPVVVRVGTTWRQQQGITIDDVWVAGTRAMISLEGAVTPIPPCSKCCPDMRTCVQLNVTTFQQFGPHSDPDGRTEAFCFDNCKSYCTSSRLHFGGNFVLRMTLMRRSDGARVWTGASLPFTTYSRVPRNMPRAPKDPYQTFTDMSPVVEKIEISPQLCKPESTGVPVLIHLNVPAADPGQASTTDVDSAATAPKGLGGAGFFPPEPKQQPSSSLFGLRPISPAAYSDIIEEYYAMSSQEIAEAEWLLKQERRPSPFPDEMAPPTDACCTAATEPSVSPSNH